MALFACAGEGDSYQGFHRAECGVGCVFRLSKPICVVGEQRRCVGFDALVHGHGVGGFGNHADMPSRVPEAQPLVSDEADESEAFASLALALGKKIDCEGARFSGAFFYGAERCWEDDLRRGGIASLKRACR